MLRYSVYKVIYVQVLKQFHCILVITILIISDQIRNENGLDSTLRDFELASDIFHNIFKGFQSDVEKSGSKLLLLYRGCR